MENFQYPTLDEILGSHDSILQETGGSSGLLNRGTLEAALDRARHGPFAWDGGLAERAALLIRGIVQDHPFADGNKRTGVAVLESVLESNGYALDAEDEAVEAFVMEVAQGVRELQTMTSWIDEHMRKL